MLSMGVLGRPPGVADAVAEVPQRHLLAHCQCPEPRLAAALGVCSFWNSIGQNSRRGRKVVNPSRADLRLGPGKRPNAACIRVCHVSADRCAVFLGHRSPSWKKRLVVPTAIDQPDLQCDGH